MTRETLTHRLTRTLPPNTDARQVRRLLALITAAGLGLCSLDFLIRYTDAYRSLFHLRWNGSAYERVLLSGARMADFDTFTAALPLCAAVLAVLGLGLAAMLYASFYQGGRSIYLMRRLPDGGRALRRCVWTAPLVWMALCAAALCVLTLIFYLTWRFVTPPACLPYAAGL